MATAATCVLPTNLRPWQLAIEVLARIEQMTGSTGGVETAGKLLAANSHQLYSKVSYPFVDELADCLEQGNNASASQIRFFPLVTASHLHIFVLACRALLVKHFGLLLRKSCRASGITTTRAAVSLGIGRAKWRNWLHSRSRFPTDMTPAQALQIDQLLGANGAILAAYAATSQYSAFSYKQNIADKLLQRTSFGHLLRSSWRRPGLTKRALLARISTDTGIAIAEGVFGKWCRGLALPGLEKEAAIAALDEILGLAGQLVKAWKDATPRATYAPYGFPRKSWPAKLEAEFQRLFPLRAEDSVDFYDDELAASSQWRAATRELFVEFAEHVFGYALLLQENGTVAEPDPAPAAPPEPKMKFCAESISFTLMGDWQLVAGYHSFRQTRVGRDCWNCSDLNETKTLLSLYRRVMPRLASDAAQQPYWNSIFSPGNADELSGDDAEKVQAIWQKQIELATASAWDFLESNTFERRPFRSKIQPLLDREVAMRAMAAEIEAGVTALPIQALCLKTAVAMRQYAAAALLWARCFRPATLALLDLSHVFLDDGRVGTNIPEGLFKNDGDGGSEGGVKGQLADIPWFFVAIRKWLKEGRPFIVNHALAKGGTDANYFLTAVRLSPTQAPGGPVSNKTLYNDTLAVHGYPPYGQRYFFASATWIAYAPIEDIACTMQNTANIALKFYAEATEAQKSARASKAMAALLACGG